MSATKCPVHPKLRSILNDSGVPWHTVPKRKHWQLIIAGSVVLTSPYARQETAGRQWANSVACVRRAIRMLQGDAS